MSAKVLSHVKEDWVSSYGDGEDIEASRLEIYFVRKAYRLL